MKNNITEIVFILDKSGSMSRLERDTIGGFNSTIENHKNNEGTTYVTTVLFSQNTKTIHDRVLISEIAPMTEEDYRAYGGTALLDAIGKTINHFETIHKYGRAEDIPDNTIFVITTDGEENSSTIYNSEAIKAKITEKQEKDGWKFLFLGANIDSFRTASKIGISHVANFEHTSRGVQASHKTIDYAISRAMCSNLSFDDINWQAVMDKFEKEEEHSNGGTK